MNTVKTPGAIVKLSGRAYLLSAISSFRLHQGMVLLTFTNENGRVMSGGIVIKPGDLSRIAHAASMTRRPRTPKGVKTIYISKPTA